MHLEHSAAIPIFINSFKKINDLDDACIFRLGWRDPRLICQNLISERANSFAKITIEAKQKGLSSSRH